MKIFISSLISGFTAERAAVKRAVAVVRKRWPAVAFRYIALNYPQRRLALLARRRADREQAQREDRDAGVGKNWDGLGGASSSSADHDRLLGKRKAGIATTWRETPAIGETKGVLTRRQTPYGVGLLLRWEILLAGIRARQQKTDDTTAQHLNAQAWR